MCSSDLNGEFLFGVLAREQAIQPVAQQDGTRHAASPGAKVLKCGDFTTRPVGCAGGSVSRFDLIEVFG